VLALWSGRSTPAATGTRTPRTNKPFGAPRPCGTGLDTMDQDHPGEGGAALTVRNVRVEHIRDGVVLVRDLVPLEHQERAFLELMGAELPDALTLPVTQVFSQRWKRGALFPGGEPARVGLVRAFSGSVMASVYGPGGIWALLEEDGCSETHQGRPCCACKDPVRCCDFVCCVLGCVRFPLLLPFYYHMCRLHTCRVRWSSTVSSVSVTKQTRKRCSARFATTHTLAPLRTLHRSCVLTEHVQG
jgi:hypothetical protein